MESYIEHLITNIVVGSMVLLIVFSYIRRRNKQYNIVREKIDKAIKLGFHEPVSLHPVVDLDMCIGSGACITACPEKDILGIVDGQAKDINASRCVGHGACFHACPVHAITLVIGSEKRGVELPHVNSTFESNVRGIYIAGELGGMGLIRNAVQQGIQAVENIASVLQQTGAQYDLVIIGAGPAGIAASLTAIKHKMKSVTLEQDSLGGTVFSFPRKKLVMTAPMDLPLFGKVKMTETTKTELLGLWNELITKFDIPIKENEKVVSIDRFENYFVVHTVHNSFAASNILLAIGRRGSPRKLGVPGEEKEKVFYRLLEPELVKNQDVLVVGGGDSAIESAMLLADEQNKVILSYRSDKFSRLKPRNLENIQKAEKEGIIKVLLNSTVKKIEDKSVTITIGPDGNTEEIEFDNDLVYVLIGGELPNEFLKKLGISITTKFGEAILKH